MSKKRRKNRKVVRFRKPFNIGILFFGAIFAYMLIYIYMYFTSVHISGYEVIAGSLATDKQFNGLILRTEEIFYADAAGNIDYYANEGSKVSGASLVYTIDENGRMSEYLKQNSEEANLTDENYASLRDEISSFAENYSSLNFSATYQFHNSANGSIMELLNQTLLEEMEDAAALQDSAFAQVYASKSGIIEYSIDGLENVTSENITVEMFDSENYQEKSLRSVNLVNVGDPVYKLITDENWSMIVPVSSEQMEEIAFKNVLDEEGNISKQPRTVVEVQFLKDHTTAWATLSAMNLDGNDYLKLDFNNSMVRFASERYMDIQFMIEDTSGLKIPATSITTKDFFVIPEDYIVKGGSEDKEGFMVERFDENGNSTQKFVSPTFYSKTNGMVYIDPNEGSFTSKETYIQSGDRILVPNSNDLYQVGKTEELNGVYCINQGYTQFKKIEVLYENEEYTIVREGTSYGLTIYDRIVLNADAVSEDQVIY
ncbi:MAG: HlyD family efflux transporter periplasmic adaptor subunit [Lachnospiraceae bacterium]